MLTRASGKKTERSRQVYSAQAVGIFGEFKQRWGGQRQHQKTLIGLIEWRKITALHVRPQRTLQKLFDVVFQKDTWNLQAKGFDDVHIEQ